MSSLSDFQQGYDNYISIYGGGYGAYCGGKYVGDVKAEIDRMADCFNNPQDKRFNWNIDRFQGIVAERWHAAAYNIDAARKGKLGRAQDINNNGIADVGVNNGDKYQLKYGAPKYNIKGIALTWGEHKNYHQYVKDCEKRGITPISGKQFCEGHDPDEPYYAGQFRLIPADQLIEIQKALRLKIAAEGAKRPELVARWQDALDFLTDRIKTGDGVESIPLSRSEARELAIIIKEHQLNNGKEFDPADWGLTTEDLITNDYIFNQALKAGLTAAIISVIMKVGQELCGIIMQLIKDGEIDANRFKKLGFEAVTGGVEGYISGSIAASIAIECAKGSLGEVLKNTNPNIIGAITVIALNTVKNSCLLAFGKIDKQEFVSRCGRDIVITACSVGAGIGGAAIASFFFTPAAAVFGYMIGSFVGTVIGSFAYKGIEYCVMAICVETGFTFFGLVEQNYELPNHVIEETGLAVYDYERKYVQLVECDTIDIPIVDYESNDIPILDVTFLRRGVIGVGKVGFVDDYGSALV